MTLNTRENKIKIIFAQHPNQKEIFMTSDDRAFFDVHKADAYAQNLQDKKVSHITRKLFEVFEEAKTAGDTADTSETKPEGSADESGETTEANETITEAVASAEAEPLDRAVLSARYEELLGKKPTNFMKTETIAARIAEAEAEANTATN